MLHIDPRPSCQKKKCTCVNNWCIRSKISGDQGMTLTVKELIWVRIETLARSRWTSNCYITSATREFCWVGEKMLEWEPCPSRGWAPRPPVEQPRRTGKKGCDSQKSWRVNILLLCSVSNSLSQTTLSIKREVYFSKELCLLVFIVSSLCFCMHLYMYYVDI